MGTEDPYLQRLKSQQDQWSTGTFLIKDYGDVQSTVYSLSSPSAEQATVSWANRMETARGQERRARSVQVLPEIQSPIAA